MKNEAVFVLFILLRARYGESPNSGIYETECVMRIHLLHRAVFLASYDSLQSVRNRLI